MKILLHHVIIFLVTWINGGGSVGARRQVIILMFAIFPPTIHSVDLSVKNTPFTSTKSHQLNHIRDTTGSQVVKCSYSHEFFMIV